MALPWQHGLHPTGWGAEKEKLFLADVAAQLSPSRGDASHHLRQA